MLLIHMCIRAVATISAEIFVQSVECIKIGARAAKEFEKIRVCVRVRGRVITSSWKADAEDDSVRSEERIIHRATKAALNE